MKNLILIITLLFCLPLLSLGQNEPQFTQVSNNEVYFNPAAIGNANRINATLLGRKQWYGFDGSPTTELLTVDTYIQKIYGGVGLSIYNDKIGYENTMNLRAMYSYPVQINNDMLVTLGLGVGVINKSIQGSKLIYEDNTDQAALYGNISEWRPDFSFGGELNATQGYTVGLSAIHLDKSTKGSTLKANPRHYYLYGKYIVEVDDNVNVIPYLLVKSTLYATQFELNVTGTFDREMWWAGLSYRHQSAFAMQLGINFEKAGVIDEDIRLGYAYDFGIGGISTHSGGSHEIMLIATFDGLNKTRVKPRTPRLF